MGVLEEEPGEVGVGMWVQLRRKTVVELYCYSREAERSVDAALFADWTKLRDYYRSEKQRAIQSLVQRLHEAAPCDLDLPPRIRDELTTGIFWRILLRHSIGKWMAHWENVWSFSQREIRFMGSVLERFLGLLTLERAPQREFLISVRMDLNLCEYIIESHCYGMVELRLARNIEHFNQSDHVKPIALAALLGERSQPLERELTQRTNRLVQ